MSRINTEFFIARRISSKKNNENRNIMVRIATITVAVSTAVMIIALAVIFGFKSAITAKLTGFSGDIQIINYDNNTSFETTPIERNTELEQSIRAADNFKSINAYAIKGGIIKTDNAMQGIMLKGVDGGFDWTFFRENMAEGEIPVVWDSARNKDIIISRQLSNTLMLNIADRIEILFTENGTAPRRDRYKVSGIYSTGLEEMDMIVVLTDIRNVQRLNGWDTNQITGYEVHGRDFSKISNFTHDVYRRVLANMNEYDQSLLVMDVRQKYPNLFDWLSAHNVNALVVIIIMILVSLLNMISAMLIILLERTRMIGILKTLGMTNSSVQKIFIQRSAGIIAKGMLWGNVVGLGICILQYYTHLLKLDETGYFLSYVPVSLDLWWLVLLNAGIFTVITLFLIIPTSLVSKVSPEKTIRYQ